MPVVKIDGADLDVAQTGTGRDLVLLHSLLTDRSAFDLVGPPLAKTRRLTLVLERIRNPTLVMAGALDQTPPPTLARALANGIPGAKFLEIPGCGHCPQIENPQAFIDGVNAFLPR